MYLRVIALIHIRKKRRPGWSTRQVVCGAITKDEEEIAEALYALTEMFPHSASNAPRIEPKSESLPEESANATFEALLKMQVLVLKDHLEELQKSHLLMKLRV